MSAVDSDILDNFDRAEVKTDEGFYSTIFRLHDLSRECAIPAVVRSYDREHAMARVQPIICYEGDTDKEVVTVPRSLYRVPVVTFAHGGFVVSAPLFPGDTGWLIAGDRSSKKARAEFGGIRDKAQEPGDSDYSEGVRRDNGEILSFENGFFIPSSFGESGLTEDNGLVIKKLAEDGSETSILLKDGEVKVDGKLLEFTSDDGSGKSSFKLNGGDLKLSADKVVVSDTAETGIITVANGSVSARSEASGAEVAVDEDGAAIRNGEDASVSVSKEGITAKVGEEVSVEAKADGVTTRVGDSVEFSVGSESVSAKAGGSTEVSISDGSISAKISTSVTEDGDSDEGTETVVSSLEITGERATITIGDESVSIDGDGLHHTGGVDGTRTIITAVRVSGNKVQQKSVEASVRGDFIVGVGEEPEGWTDAEGTLPQPGPGGTVVIEPNRIAVSDDAGNITAMGELTSGTLVKASGTGSIESLPKMDGSKWMKTDQEGLPTTTEETPIALDGNPGFIYDNSGTIAKVQFGTEKDTVAEGNHNHTHSDVTDLGAAALLNVGSTTGTVAAGDHNHDDTYAPLEHGHNVSDIERPSTSTGKVYVVFANGSTSASTQSGISVSDMNTSDTKQYNRYPVVEGGSTSVTLAESIPLSDITGDIGGHTGNCLVIVEDDGTLTHSGNTWYDALNDIVADYTADQRNYHIPYLKDGGFEKSKWVVTGEDGNLTTTNETPITLDGSPGLVYDSNGEITKVLIGTADGTVAAGDHVHANYVTVDTAETISGSKTFSHQYTYAQSLIIKQSSGTLWGIRGSGNTWNGLGIFYNNNAGTPVFNANADASSIYIGNANSVKTVSIYAPANGAMLHNQPTISDSNTDSRAIATCGWCNSKLASSSDFEGLKSLFVLKDDGTPERIKAGAMAKCNIENSILIADENGDICTTAHLEGGKWMKTDSNGHPTVTNDTPITASSTATGVVYNTMGSISHLPIGTASGTVAAGNHTHSGYAASSHNHGNIGAGGIVTEQSAHKGYVVGQDSTGLYACTQLEMIDIFIIYSLFSLDDTTRQPSRLINDALPEQITTTQQVTIEFDTGSGGGNSSNLFLAKNKTTSERGFFGAANIWLDSNVSTNILFRNTASTILAKIVGHTNKKLSLTAYSDNGVTLGGTIVDDESEGSTAVPTMGWVNKSFLRSRVVAPETKDTINPTSTNADTNGWTNDGTTGLSITQVVRVQWDSGTGKFYKYTRTFTYAGSGQLQAVSGETRSEIDTPTIISWE